MHTCYDGTTCVFRATVPQHIASCPVLSRLCAIIKTVMTVWMDTAAAEHPVLHPHVFRWAPAAAAVRVHHLCSDLLGREVGAAEAEPCA